MTTAEPEQNTLLALTGVETGLLDALMPDGVHTCLCLLLRGQVNGRGPGQTWAVVVDEVGLLGLLEALNTAAQKHFLPKEEAQS